MESDHQLKPGHDDPASAGPNLSQAAPPRIGSLLPPGVDDEDEAGAAAAPQVSTVLGPLPAAVPAGQTRDLNDAVHKILVIGLAISTVLLVIGLLLELISARALPEATVSPGEALRRTLQLRPSGFLSLGLLVLMFTPVVRVIGSIVVFLWERDWLYMAITIFVLIVMLVSVLLGSS